MSIKSHLYEAKYSDLAVSLLEPNIEQAFINQFNVEIYNSHVYMQMRAILEVDAWDGFAHWMGKQSEEEHSHAEKIFKFLVDKNVTPTLTGISQPAVEGNLPIDLFQSALALEKDTTGKILALRTLCEPDQDSHIFLQWFVEEQRQEEAVLINILQKFVKAKGDYAALKLLDDELGKR